VVVQRLMLWLSSDCLLWLIDSSGLDDDPIRLRCECHRRRTDTRGIERVGGYGVWACWRLDWCALSRMKSSKGRTALLDKWPRGVAVVLRQSAKKPMTTSIPWKRSSRVQRRRPGPSVEVQSRSAYQAGAAQLACTTYLHDLPRLKFSARESNVG
jgi:hypothetical protein